MHQCDNGFESYCDDFSSYIEGDLGSERTSQIEAHLAECPACRETVQRMRSLQERLQQLPSITVSPDFDERLHQRLRQPGRHFAGFPTIAASTGWRLSAAAAAAVIVVAGGMMMWQDEPAQIELRPRQSSFSPSLTPRADGADAATPTEGAPGQVQQAGGEQLSTTESDSIRQNRKNDLRDRINLVNEKR